MKRGSPKTFHTKKRKQRETVQGTLSQHKHESSSSNFTGWRKEMEGSSSNSTDEPCTKNLMKQGNRIGCFYKLQLNVSVFPGGKTARAVWPPSYQAMGDQPHGGRESLDNRNQAKKRFLSGQGRYACLFSQVKGIL